MTYVPLVESVFEVRFNPTANLATQLLLEVLTEFPNKIRVENSEGLKFPEEIKQIQNELYFIPSYKAIYEDFSLYIADGSLIVLKDYIAGQYQGGWEEFKPIILKIISILKKPNNNFFINRYSLKYTNFFEDNKLEELNLLINLSLGEKNISFKDKFEFKNESNEEDYITILNLASNVNLVNFNEITMQQKQLFGFLFVIDVISQVKSFNLEQKDIAENLDKLHTRIYQEFRKVYPNKEEEQ